jgi:hypothetical protein
MSVSVVLDDKVSDGAGDCKCCLGDGPDDVEFAGMFINNVDGVGISARRCVWELVYVEIENGTWGSGWCRCGWGILWFGHFPGKAMHTWTAEVSI